MTEGAEIEAALAEVSRALQAGDIAAAATAVETLVACCEEASALRLTTRQVDRLAEMLSSCNELAAATQDRLTDSLLQFGNGGRAQRAYGDR